MKNTLVLIITFMTLGFTINAQKYVAAIEDKSGIDHESGVYEFYVNASEISEEDVNNAANYYTDYFSVKQKEDDGLRVIMVYLDSPGDEMSINIIMRLLVTLKIDKVNYVGSEIELHPFFSEYMIKK